MNLAKRRDMIMENPVMLSCIYLDPRFSFELSTDQKKIAMAHIQSTYTRLLSLEDVDAANESSEDTDSIASGMVSDDEDILYERHLRKKHHQIKRTEQEKPSFDAALLSFQQVKRLNSKEGILKWWETNKETYALLFPVACVILGVPGTQVSVEQLFSQVKFILNDLRSNLDSSNFQNIMIIRCNFSHLDQFFDTS